MSNIQHLSSDAPSTLAAETISRLLERYSQTPVLFLVSGGSALTVLEQIDSRFLTDRLTLAMVDERFDVRPAVNNFSQLTALKFFREATAAQVSWIETVPKEGETLSEFTLRYEQALKRWRTHNPTGTIIAFLGMGVDGHTAGIMPGYTASFADTSAWVVGYEVPPEVSLYTKRATVTPRFLVQEVTAAVAFVVGLDKRPTLQRVLAQSTDEDTCPAIIWHEMKELTIVTDS